MSVFNKNTRRVLSYDVLRQQKRGYDQGGCFRRGGVDLRLRHITSNQSQTLRRRLVRTTNDGRRGECSAGRLPPFVAALFFTLRNSYGFAFFPTHLHSTPPLWEFPSEYRHPVWHRKTKMTWLSDGGKISKISLFVLTQHMNMSDTQTHTA